MCSINLCSLHIGPFISTNNDLQPKVLLYLGLLLFFLVPFSSYGGVLFAGLFRACNDTSVRNKGECTGVFIDLTTGLLVPRVWKDKTVGFDTMYSGILTLFEMMMEE